MQMKFRGFGGENTPVRVSVNLEDFQEHQNLLESGQRIDMSDPDYDAVKELMEDQEKETDRLFSYFKFFDSSSLLGTDESLLKSMIFDSSQGNTKVKSPSYSYFPQTKENGTLDPQKTPLLDDQSNSEQPSTKPMPAHFHSFNFAHYIPETPKKASIGLKAFKPKNLVIHNETQSSFFDPKKSEFELLKSPSRNFEQTMKGVRSFSTQLLQETPKGVQKESGNSRDYGQKIDYALNLPKLSSPKGLNYLNTSLPEQMDQLFIYNSEDYGSKKLISEPLSAYNFQNYQYSNQNTESLSKVGTKKFTPRGTPEPKRNKSDSPKKDEINFEKNEKPQEKSVYISDSKKEENFGIKEEEESNSASEKYKKPLYNFSLEGEGNKIPSMHFSSLRTSPTDSRQKVDPVNSENFSNFSKQSSPLTDVFRTNPPQKQPPKPGQIKRNPKHLKQNASLDLSMTVLHGSSSLDHYSSYINTSFNQEVTSFLAGDNQFKTHNDSLEFTNEFFKNPPSQGSPKDSVTITGYFTSNFEPGNYSFSAENNSKTNSFIESKEKSTKGTKGSPHSSSFLLNSRSINEPQRPVSSFEESSSPQTKNGDTPSSKKQKPFSIFKKDSLNSSVKMMKGKLRAKDEETEPLSVEKILREVRKLQETILSSKNFGEEQKKGSKDLMAKLYLLLSSK